MPEMKPSILKPADVPQLRKAKTMNQDAKAAAYSKLRPGVDIPEGQKAQRYELMQHRAENGIVSRRRKATVGAISITNLPLDENGKLLP